MSALLSIDVINSTTEGLSQQERVMGNFFPGSVRCVDQEVTAALIDRSGSFALFWLTADLQFSTRSNEEPVGGGPDFGEAGRYRVGVLSIGSECLLPDGFNAGKTGYVR